jgi:ubiquinone/menaquinone biosynthesis C-methylase UbiE
MTETQPKLGNYTGLASDYARFRAGYAPEILDAIRGILPRPASEIEAIDLGAGTGIWTRQMRDAGFSSLTAIEPNADMRSEGVRDPRNAGVRWLAGTAEATTLADASVDVVCMASSFHWADFELATTEIQRVLRQNGWFVALWNPRRIESHPVFVEIENYIRELRPDIERCSSGRATFTNGLSDRLLSTGRFDRVVYLEGRHQEVQSVEHYLGIWRSVNDVQVQLGPDRFAEFLRFAEVRVRTLPLIEVQYETRAWVSRRTSGR